MTFVTIVTVDSSRIKLGTDATTEIGRDMSIIDPGNTRTLPKMVAACTSFDVLAHTLESHMAPPCNQKQAPSTRVHDLHTMEPIQ